MGYRLLPRAPLLDPSIPMSFVMSAGLVQVENSLSREQNRKGDQVVLVQECFRHFDLDKVGNDDSHLSLFEMPGAFAFGLQDKEVVIRRMYQLATEVFGIRKNYIWATYFKGGEVQNHHFQEDVAARHAWLQIGVPENHLIGLGPENNLWVQGKGLNGSELPRKCGPNTELFFDRGEDKACGVDCRPGCKCGRFLEFSNSLFICSEFDEDNHFLYSLANPFTETVIGTERVAMILQNVDSVFDTDGYRSLIETIDRFVKRSDLSRVIPAYTRVIADHLKGLYFLIADGAPPPGKDGRARIIKMLIRRVITRQIVLGIESELFLTTIIKTISCGLPPSVQMREIQERFVSYFDSESQHFKRTIAQGHIQLIKLLKENGGRTLSGSQIVFLEKKCGLPTLLIGMILQKQGLPFMGSVYKKASNNYPPAEDSGVQ
jgi:alanyl-tRNA synthetase